MSMSVRIGGEPVRSGPGKASQASFHVAPTPGQRGTEEAGPRTTKPECSAAVSSHPSQDPGVPPPLAGLALAEASASHAVFVGRGGPQSHRGPGKGAIDMSDGSHELLTQQLAGLLGMGSEEEEYVSDVLGSLVEVADNPGDVAEYLSSFGCKGRG
ncbi:hypothetical protein THAOC_13905, partial [Thalassiosira oceanica]